MKWQKLQNFAEMCKKNDKKKQRSANFADLCNSAS
jgi:hypothetical protein